MQEYTDEELVIAVQSGDITAFEQLVRRYQRRLLYVARRIVLSHEAAEEVVQDALFSFYQTIERIDTARTVKSYIYAIARNAAISYIRTHHYESRFDELTTVDDDTDFVDALWNEDKKTEIHRALKRLSPSYRRVIQLYYFDELSYKEMSERLHIPVNTIRTHLSRAKKALKRYFISL